MQPQLLVCFAVLLWLGSTAEGAAPAKGAKTIDVKKCKALGFTGEAKCSQCDSLQEFVKDSGLVAECKQCCVKDEGARYVSVELQVNVQRLSGQPEIKHFVEKMAKSYGKLLKVNLNANLNVGSRLKCKKAEGGHDIIRVDSWKRSSFEEFFADRVEGVTK